jgi:hypothetical protein
VDGGNLDVSIDKRGTIGAVGAGSFDLKESADGGLDGGLGTSHWTIKISGLRPSLPLYRGMAVRVQYQVSFFWVCHDALRITAADTSELLLEAVDAAEPIDDAPYYADLNPLDCDVGPGTGCNGVNPPADYSYVFSSTEPGAPKVEVFMGEAGNLLLGSKTYTAYNLRSYDTGYCDDYWNFAYFISR